MNCIGTEFTPKKHGGEKGVPFRLQIETYLEADDSDRSASLPVRVHAASCILQIFKLKGADRKHKQDREKINKRPQAEQEKFAPSYDCTVLADLKPEDVFNPPPSDSSPGSGQAGTSGVKQSLSRSGTPTKPPSQSAVSVQQANSEPVTLTTSVPSYASSLISRDTSPVNTQTPFEPGGCGSGRVGAGGTNDHSYLNQMPPPPPPPPPSTSGHQVSLASTPASSLGSVMRPPGGPMNCLTAGSSVEAVVAWLTRNRFGAHLGSLRNFNGRDMLRLTREEMVTLCGGSLGDGVRMYNELHLAPVAPVATFYLAPKNTVEYSALFLQEPTAEEFLRRLAGAIGLPPSLFSRLFVLGPHGILIRVTDNVVTYMKPETVFQFSLRSGNTDVANRTQQSQASCDIILEDMSANLAAISSSGQMGGGHEDGGSSGVSFEGGELVGHHHHHQQHGPSGPNPAIPQNQVSIQHNLVNGKIDNSR